MNSATTTSVETSNGSATRRGAPNLTEVEPPDATTSERISTTPQKKYRHAAAVHSKVRPSCLSHDSDAAPSFLGFRNLMVIVLGGCLMNCLHLNHEILTVPFPVVGNLRLMIENLQKVSVPSQDQ